MAATFDGVDDRYDLAAESTLRYEYTQAFSGHAWVKKDSVTGNCIMGKANNSPPAADQRGWAFNTENASGSLALSFHLVNTTAVHAFVQGNDPVAAANSAVIQPGLWCAVGFTYDGSGLTSGVTLYANGQGLNMFGGMNTLAGNTILVNGTPMTIGGFDTEFWAGTSCGILLVPAELSAAEMAALADLRNFNRNPATFLGTAPDVWLPLRKQSGAVDLTDYSGNGHTASVGGGAPAVADDPTVVLDAFVKTDFTSSTSFTHAPNGTVTGVVVVIAQNISSADLISGVTYGGVAMTRLPTNGLAQDTVGEPGAAYAYLLTAGVPPGAQTVAITVSSGTDAKSVWVTSLTSLSAVGVAASGKAEGDLTNPSVTSGTVANWVGMAINVCYSGQNAPASLTAGTGYLKLGPGRDSGSQAAVAATGNFSGASHASGWTAAAEDTAMIAIALQSNVSAPPSRNPTRHMIVR